MVDSSTMKKLFQIMIAVCLLSAAFAFAQTPHIIVNIPDSTVVYKPVNVHVIARHADGYQGCHLQTCVFADNWIHNLRTTGGADWQANVMAGTSNPAAITYFALSNNATAPAAGDCPAGSTACTLSGEISTNGLARHVATFSHTNGTNTLAGAYTWTATGTQSVQEAGWFDASSSGTMVFEAAFTPVTLVSTDTFTVIWTLAF